MSKATEFQKRRLYADTYRKWMQRTHLSNTYDMPHKVPADFYPDDDCYTNHEMIHLGFGGTYEALGAKDDVNEFIDVTNYVLQHEEFHCRYTVSGIYQQAIRKSMENIIEYGAAKLEGHPVRFRKDTDYQDYVDKKYREGIHINARMIGQIVSYIENSLEDGRIERIGAGKYPGFALLRVKFRGRTWNTEMKYQKWEEIENSSKDKLTVLLNYILSMATCQLYPKGFFIAYAGTPMLDMANDLMPHIATAYMASRSNKLASETIKICDKLKDLIFDVCTCPVSEDQRAFEQMMKDLITAIVNSMPDTGLTQSDEEEDTEQSTNSTFGNSDMTITLDDETYDKLMKNAKKSNGESGINVRREHPLEEDENKSEENSKGGSKTNPDDKNSENNQNGSQGASNDASNGSESASNSETASNGSSESNDDSDKKNGQSSSSNGEQTDDEKSDENGNGSSTSGSSDDASSENQSSSTSESQQGAKKEKQEEYSDSTGSTNNSELLKKHSAKKMKEIEEQIKAVEESLKSESQSITEMVSRTHSNDRRETSSTKEVKDTEKPIQAEAMKDICDFIEEKRDYEVDKNLPVDIEARGKVLRRKNRQYFKGLSTPNITYLDSGSVDPSRLYSLSFGDSNVFRKIGKDKHFDGCVYVLIDNSGSMESRDKYGVTKREEACKAAAVIEEGFKGFLPMKIVAFDETRVVRHKVVKGWNESLRKNCCWNFCKNDDSGYGNADGFDIQIATRELMKRPEKKKLLIVLSDGMPSEATPGYTKGAIDAARMKGIQVSGIYFENDRIGQEAEQFKQMYKKDYICCKASEIDQNLTKILMKFSRS